jgi:hypothetical protein
MHTLTPPESTGVPATIQNAEEWRVLGEKLRRESPDLYEQVFAMFARMVIELSERADRNITESYFIT